MNNMQIKDRLKNISHDNSIDFNLLLRNYMYERFIERLANSRYKEKFILKGGYYLSVLFGVDSRYTMDIDLSLKNEMLSKNNIIKMLEEIISQDIKDNAVFTINDITKIREEDKYYGYRVKLTVKIENIKEIFNVDIATGDPITPKEINFKYRTILDYKYIDLCSYNLETVIAEKLETILSKKDFNSRMKDYYDIHLIYTLAKNKIDLNNLVRAIEKTFENRNFKDNIKESSRVIKNSEILKFRWNSYASKNKYVHDITYNDVINCLESITEVLEQLMS